MRPGLRPVRAETLIAGLGSVLVAVMVFSAVDGGASTPSGPSAAQRDETRRVTYVDEKRGFSITYPAHWFRAKESLTPHLEDPAEIFSVGTFELEPGAKECAQFAGNAMEHMRPNDVLVSIQESSGPLEAVPLEGDWTLASGYGTEAQDCLTNLTPFEDRLIALESNGRYVYAFFAIGREAGQGRREEAVEVVRSLELDP